MWRKSARLLVGCVMKPELRLPTRSVVSCRAEWSASEEGVTISSRTSDHHRRYQERSGGDSRGRNSHKHGRYGPSSAGLSLAAVPVAAVWAGSNSQDGDTKAAQCNSDAEEHRGDSQIVDQGRLASLMSRLGLNAAEPFNPGEEGDDDGGKGGKASRKERFNFIADVVEETAPALVYIEIKDTAHRDFFTGHPMTSSNGSGFIVKSDGLILTNAHVVIKKPRAAIQVRLHNGDVYAGTVEDVDVKSDLATVRIQCRDLPVMKLGDSSCLRAGEFVVAMGSPLSLSNTITTGVISNVARPPIELGLQGPLQGRDVPEYIQTDAAITFGNSGGPLINLDGEAIGINSMKVTPGISFAIPIDYAKEFLVKSEEAGRSGWPASGKRRYIGITMLSLTPQIMEELRQRGVISSSVTGGILIYRLVVGSPGDQAGLRTGDIITHINGHQVFATRDLYKTLEGTESPLVFRIVRDNTKVLNLNIIPENLP